MIYSLGYFTNWPQTYSKITWNFPSLQHEPILYMCSRFQLNPHGTKKTFILGFTRITFQINFMITIQLFELHF